TVSYTVKNTGPASANARWSDGIYLSTRNTLDSSAILLATQPIGSKSPLADGATYTQNVQVTLPLGATTFPGTYYLLVKPDYVDEMIESDPDNATSSQALTVTLPPLPNLVVEGVSGPASGYTGKSVLLSWTDHNTGTATASTWVDNVYLAT